MTHWKVKPCPSTLLLLLVFVTLDLKLVSGQKFVFACDRDVFCKGNVLDAVQMARVYEDSKTFVDLRYKVDPASVKDELENAVTKNFTREEWKSLLDQVFHPPGGELVDSKAPDWTESPSVLRKIEDGEYKRWASFLNDVWRKLTRRMKLGVKHNSTQTSLIYSQHPFVIPGGRFREFYYWDTYWAVSGLLASDMTTTVAGMIDNLIDLVNEVGFVPNGGRVYYKNRSQPPFLTLMVSEYLKHTNDLAFVKDRLSALAKEYSFWANRNVDVRSPKTGVQYTMRRYATPLGYPRPESYYEDIMTMREAGYAGDLAKAQQLFSHIASAAESGWDFSSRWFNHTGPHANEMASIRTSTIVPVCLNSILCKVEHHLADFYNRTGNTAEASRYRKMWEQTVASVDDVLWNEEHGQWLDFDLLTQKHRNGFYVSNLYPLWAGCYRENATRSKIVVDKLKELGVLDFVGGIPTSLRNTGQQWDFPNAWPPLQDIVETALRESGTEDGKELAFNLARKWLESNYKAWRQTGHMFEKYDAKVSGTEGRGGEYKVQVGFGWSNGVALKFLQRYGHNLTAPVVQASSGLCLRSGLLAVLPLVLVTAWLA